MKSVLSGSKLPIESPVIAHSLAIALVVQGKYSEAVNVLRESMRSHPDLFARSHILLGRILLDQNILSAAEAEFRKGMNVARNIRGWKFVDAWHSEAAEGLILVLLRQGRIAEAEALISHIDLARNQAWLEMAIGLEQLTKGDFREAEDRFKRASEFDPSDTTIRDAVNAVKLQQNSNQ